MDLTPILLVVIAAAGIYAWTLFKKVAGLQNRLSGEARQIEDKRSELEKARKEAREGKEQLEETRKQLQEARTKLKKRERETEKEGAPKKGPRRDSVEEAPANSPMIVRISDEQLSAEHRKSVERYEEEIATLKNELAEMKKRDQAMAREHERAAKALHEASSQAAATAAPAAAPVEARSGTEETVALKAQLEVMTRAAIDNERALKKELRRAEDTARQSLRRAANNAQLYQVIKGQLELAEDRLAAYKLKYEGAKSIDELKKENKRDRGNRQRRREREESSSKLGEAEPSVEAEQMRPADESSTPSSSAAPSSIEVAQDQIVAEAVASAEKSEAHSQ